MTHSNFAAAFTSGARLRHLDLGRIEMSVRELGSLQLPTGRLVVCDPFTSNFDSVLSEPTPIGTFPVEVALAKFGTDERVACARVRFSSAPAVRWERDGAAFAVGAGTACFLDASAGFPTEDAMVDAWIAGCNATQVETWSWHAGPLGEANVVMFSSGFGDGAYVSYRGFDAEGQVVEIVTDFDVLTEMTRERIELELPLREGEVAKAPGVVVTAKGNSVRVEGHARVWLSNDADVARLNDQWFWKPPPAGTKLIVEFVTGERACALE